MQVKAIQQNANRAVGKLLYAIVFLLVLPLIQWRWALALDRLYRFPKLQSDTAGLVTGIAGIILVAWGMLSLMKFGKGLPMNAYPPPLFVKRGPYRFFRHPIYWGYGMAMAGAFVYIGSGAGCWVVTTVTFLGMQALLMGYEEIDLGERFRDADRSVWLDIPPPGNEPPSLSQRFASLFRVLTVLLLSNFVIRFLTGDSAPALTDPFSLPVIPGIGGVKYLFTGLVAVTPFLLKDKSGLRRWTVAALIGIALSSYISLLWPGAGAQYFFPMGNLTVVFSLPVFVTLLSGQSLSLNFPKLRLLIIVIFLLLAAAQLLLTGNILLNISTGIFLFLFASFHTAIWSGIRGLAETVANSWKEWQWGPVRVINHGIYVGVGAFGGIAFCGMLVGRAYAWAILLFAFVVVVFAALWAQVIEGSEKLKRPFGYYGALVGVFFASGLLWLLGYNAWVLVGVISVIMPWVQAAGRFRCLVNGCCHGKPTENDALGIRFYHPRSRVCNISGLKGKWLHPTQVYSISWLFFAGFILLALWQHQYAYSFIFGTYLILTGAGRFVEEAYRGEVQTPFWKGLRLYQWAALVSVLAGMAFTVIPVAPIFIQPEYGWEVWVAALLGGLFTFFAMGVDFPRSNARFSRLV